MRLIDADALIMQIKHWKEHEVSDGLIGEGIKAGYDAAMICVSEMPTIKEHKHGHWIRTYNYSWKCSVCGGVQWLSSLSEPEKDKTPYCPHCGAAMDEEASDGR